MRSHSSTPAVRIVILVTMLMAVAWGALLFLAPSAAATTYVKGTISVDTTWGVADTLYIATKDVTVAATVTLTITPGTTVKFDPGVHLYVNGRLFADGTSAKPIALSPNNTASISPWAGIQFNGSAAGSVSWATFDRPDRALTAISSSPVVHDNTVLQANVGFAFISSSSSVWNNDIRRAPSIGIYLNASNAQVFSNKINGTGVGIQVDRAPSPSIFSNTITNVSSIFAVGIMISGGATADLNGNSIVGVAGARGTNPVVPGAAGRDGSIALGIYVTAAPSATIVSNTIKTVVGGRGGDGASLAGGTGGRGGNGAPAAGIVVAITPNVLVQFNTVSEVSGGRGGSGGGGAGTTNGGRGGDAGQAAGIEAVAANGFAQVYSNTVSGVAGGIGGFGGNGGTLDGNGGVGGDSDGLFFITAADVDASGNTIQALRGGLGGNSTALGGGTGNGAQGGAANGIAVFSIVRSAIVHSNTIDTLTGGDGGRGTRGGYGGNVTGVLPLGNNDAAFNATAVSFNLVQNLLGGQGGTANRFGGNGGSALGVGTILVTPTLSWNQLLNVQGGRGGSSGVGTNGGRGGDADGILAGLIANGQSSDDSISSVTKGAFGFGPPAQTSYGVGYYFIGNASLTTRFTVDNGTFASIGDYEFNVDNYTNAIAVNTPFTKLAVQAKGNLTVRNFLEVDALWPNGIAPVGGARIRVQDNGLAIWDQVAASGMQPWILVTDRVYINSKTATQNVTLVTVSYGSYGFQSNPRNVDMSTSHTEPFTMIDTDPPTSAASPLPTYENSFTFFIGYAASDGNGTGMGNITLWYRTGGSVVWTAYSTQPAGNFGFFSFTASADGVYEFATTADDIVGNKQPGPTSNNTWTIVDTVRPGSHVNPLPQYETSTSFVVSWAPDPGVTDIAWYTIEYNAGFGWVAWLVTSTTSATFTSGPLGAYAFRSIATDRAGNAEIPPAGNDTWTYVDTVPPYSHTLPLAVYETSLNFTVSWGPQFDTRDIARYQIQVRDNGGSWTVWIASTTSTSSNFSGTAGHTYEFRSIATDQAGNVEPAPSGNDSWTIVDVTPPVSVMTALPPYENVLQFVIAWGPAPGVVDIASFRVQSTVDAGAWTDVSGYANTTATSATVTGADGHVYAFRTLARDRAGNVEPTPAGNDTWTLVDTTHPGVIDSAPQGANTNTTPSVVITFSEPMSRNSVEQAFSLTPAMNGAFQWSADSRVVTFTPARALLSGTTYFVAIDSSAKDRAGNGMLQSKTFQFSTSASPASAFSISEMWWLFVLIGIAVAGALLFIMRRRGAAESPPAAPPAAAKQSDAIIEDVFLLYHRDGILIKHETRRLRPDVDTDILSGMLTAVQQFVKDALRGDDYADLNEMTVGHMHILIGRGKWLVLAARIEGDGTASWTEQIQRCIKDMEDHHWDQLEDWDGDMVLSRVLTPYIKKLLSGQYAVEERLITPAAR